MTDLGTFGASEAVVADINNHGQIAGWLKTAGGEIRAFIATPKNQ